MPHLNWRTADLGKKVVPFEGGSTAHQVDRNFVFEMVLDVKQAQELASMLTAVLIPGGGELRLSLPDEWSIFWKLRDDESRLLIAHPQADEWVATLALEMAHAHRLLAALEESCKEESSASFSIAGLADDGRVSSVSNLDLVISVTSKSSPKI